MMRNLSAFIYSASLRTVHFHVGQIAKAINFGLLIIYVILTIIICANPQIIEFYNTILSATRLAPLPLIATGFFVIVFSTVLYAAARNIPFLYDPANHNNITMPRYAIRFNRAVSILFSMSPFAIILYQLTQAEKEFQPRLDLLRGGADDPINYMDNLFFIKMAVIVCAAFFVVLLLGLDKWHERPQPEWRNNNFPDRLIYKITRFWPNFVFGFVTLLSIFLFFNPIIDILSLLGAQSISLFHKIGPLATLMAVIVVVSSSILILVFAANMLLTPVITTFCGLIITGAVIFNSIDNRRQ